MGLRIVTGLLQRPQYICPPCLHRIQGSRVPAPSRNAQKRYKHVQVSKRGKQIEQNELQWKEQADEILAGRKEGMLSMLEKRGYVNQVVGKRDDLDRLMTLKRIGIYAGIDPTAPSLHIGHLLPLMVLFWMYCHGYKSCSLLGGMTARIGDPTDRNSARPVQTSGERKANLAQVHVQLQGIWVNAEQRVKAYGYRRDPKTWRREMPNNSHWLTSTTISEFLQVMASGMRLGTQLGRDFVKNRIESSEGMSLAEFLYPSLQAWDWWHMYKTKDIQVQVGGSDQFGNILAGVDAINYIRRTHPDPVVRQDESGMKPLEVLVKRPMGFTVPLLTTASGQKFGKSAGNAIWLDGQMTSPFDLYQFFLRTADADVHRYLKLFTFEPLDILDRLMEEHDKDPSKRVAQHQLAREVLNVVHGTEISQEAEQEHARLFQNSPLVQSASLGDANRLETMSESPLAITLPRSLVYDQRMANILYHAGLVPSRSEGHRLIDQKGIYATSERWTTGKMPGNAPPDQVEFVHATHWKPEETQKYILNENMMLLRMGKLKRKTIKIVSDQEFEERGLTAPGWESLNKSTGEEQSEVVN